MTKITKKNQRSIQKNPNNDQYYKDRGYKGGKKEYAKKYGFWETWQKIEQSKRR